MAALRSRRLESLLGADLDDLDAAHIAALVTNSVKEDFDLDYKDSLYGRNDEQKRDLVGDVAALANTAGGLIILGVAEDSQGAASAADGVEISDAETVRMRQIVAAGSAPMPAFDVLTVPLTPRGAVPARGFYVIAVPRSVNAPHAVVINKGFRYPKRHGTTTRYLSEPELAAAYRDRTAGRDAQTQRITDVEASALDRLCRDARPWVLVSLVPDLAGDMELNQVTLSQAESRIGGTDAFDIVRYGSSFSRVITGRRRLIADDAGNDPFTASYASAEYHTDGAGSYAVAQIDLRERWQRDEGDAGHLLIDENIALTLLTGLARLATHARDIAGAGGNAVLRAQVVQVTGRPIEVGSIAGYSNGRSWMNAVPVDHVAAETVAELDALVMPGPMLVVAAARLLDELGNGFGVAELGHLTRDGRVRLTQWSQERQATLRGWAESHNIEVVAN